MSGRPKVFSKQAKFRQKREQQLETADDFQAAGVDFEDAAGKWRAGDPVKSLRFFQRAIEVYDQGLQKYPRSLDLAYNKARVQLEIVTHPLLVRLLPQPLTAQLGIALASHRVAIDLDPDNPDTLFNIAQVLTSLAEELARDETRDAVEPLRLLEEALELQLRCFRLQESQYKAGQQQQQQQNQQDLTQNQDQTTTSNQLLVDTEQRLDQNSASLQAQEDQWFSIIEPITLDTLIDTNLAQLNTLTSLCSVLSSFPDWASATPATLPWIEEYSTKILAKLPHIVRDDSSCRSGEVGLAKANFQVALLEAGFRTGQIDANVFQRERDAAFAQPDLRLTESVEGSIADARSLLSFSSALGATQESAHEGEAGINNNLRINAYSNARWTALSNAIGRLSKASKLGGMNADDLCRTHLLRGDASLQQFAMSQEPVRHPAATSNASRLLKNAQVFYDNANKLAPASSSSSTSSSEIEDKAIAALRSGVAVFLATADKAAILAIPARYERSEVWLKQQMDDMLVEGLISANTRIF